MNAAHPHRVELANGQRRLPLLPVGAPPPRANPHALPRALTPGFRKSQPVPLGPQPEGPCAIESGPTLEPGTSMPRRAPDL